MPSRLEVVVLAAGKGKRMRSSIPKALFKVCGRTLLEKALRAAAQLQPQRIIVVAGFGEALMREELKLLLPQNFMTGIELRIARQTEQRGTGDAVQCALGEISPEAQAVLIIPGDTPLITEKSLRPLLELGKPAELIVLTCRHPEPADFGRIVRDANGAIQRIVERKDCSPAEAAIDEINTSIYLSTPEYLREALSCCKPDNAQGEYYLTDIVDYGVRSGRAVEAAETKDFALTQGANTRFELSLLEQKMREKINRQLMEQGVSFEDPAAAYIDEGVEIEADTFIGAGTRIRGKTRIGSGVVIEGNALIEDAVIEPGCIIKLFSYIQGAQVGKNCHVGPFAHLRPGTVLEENVKIGNFVETKKAMLRSGTKANHLTYLGDAEIGPGTNVGAGTITCNYDGVNKSKTIVGKSCFIGSNTALVAPVTVGDGAYIGAGSTITQDVPAQALGIARGHQRNIEGWAERKEKTKTGGH
ncbi:MAG TPA: bifunctional UDP-N-acetylglucosamine diphosphorylase/glucosamine-1-phosphate N-acetyltransferase GlmU [Oligoflexia bacterium]|nr:bifunctional UDP-N-acetylglucosamine diphosphorylase/glucosamine-1-phosphate N-acetyltransferase GlmU [Oligoflexia bacterium]